ncbi:MAG: hypothetical protein H7Y88_10055 [Phycisphaerales bacterium]|nr:hypothetical protein [Phycisphaerales bacterium]
MSLLGAASAVAQPANNLCVNAITISDGATAFSTAGATTDGPAGCSNNQDIWYRFTANQTAQVRVETCGATNYDSYLTVYNSVTCPPTGQLACNDDSCGLQSLVQFAATAGTTYTIRLGGFSGSTGSGSMFVTYIVPPANDACANATTITDGPVNVVTIGATTDGPAACSAGNDVWYRYVAPTTGTLVVNACSGVSFTPVIAAYNGGSCPPGTTLGCSSFSCPGGTVLNVAVAQGNTYLIRVGGLSGTTGTGTIQVSTVAPPTNDLCSGPTAIGNGTFAYSTIGATTDGPPGCSAGQDVWFLYTAAATEAVAVNLCNGSTFDNAVAVYDGASCGSVQIDCDLGSCSPGSVAYFNAAAGQQYLIRVGGAGSESGTGMLAVGPGAAPPGADVILRDSSDVSHYGPIGGIHAYSIASSTCNIGGANLQWQGGTNRHPTLGMNMYRLHNGALEQIGMSWCKNATGAAATPGCGLPCNGQGGGVLGIGCQDVYGSGFNGIQSILGPRSDIDAYTGFFPVPYTIGTPSGNAIYKRLQVRQLDMTLASYPGATFFVEGVYVAPDDAEAGNWLNNATYKRATVNQSSFAVTYQGAPETTIPAIFAWRDHGLGAGVPDPAVTIVEVDIPGEGRLIVGSKVTQSRGNVYHYEYAIYNLNSDRSAGTVSVPVPAGAGVTGVGFKDVDYHSGERFSNTDWTSAVGAGAVVWSSPETFAANPLTNALRWGSMYNFRFDSVLPPGDGEMTIGLFKPGTPEAMSVTVPVPTRPSCPVDFSGDGLVGSADITSFLAAWFSDLANGTLVADFDNSGTVASADITAFLTAWFAALPVGCP